MFLSTNSYTIFANALTLGGFKELLLSNYVMANFVRGIDNFNMAVKSMEKEMCRHTQTHTYTPGNH